MRVHLEKIEYHIPHGVSRSQGTVKAGDHAAFTLHALHVDQYCFSGTTITFSLVPAGPWGPCGPGVPLEPIDMHPLSPVRITTTVNSFKFFIKLSFF